MSICEVLLKYRYYSLHTTNNCFCKRQQNSMAATERVWPAKPEYSLLVPVQKTFATTSSAAEISHKRGIKEQLRKLFYSHGSLMQRFSKHV